MGNLADWEKIRTTPLGAGGQSTVYLARRPDRRDRRQESLETLKRYSAQSLNDESSAVSYSLAVLDLAREEDPSELAALKIFNPRAAGPDAEQQARDRMRNEVAVLSTPGRQGLLKLLDHNESQNFIVTEYCHRGTPLIVICQGTKEMPGSLSLLSYRSFRPSRNFISNPSFIATSNRKISLWEKGTN